MHLFEDNKGGRVELTFDENRIGMTARHVLVILKHKEKWLLTRHSIRGIEFPGGKAEEVNPSRRQRSVKRLRKRASQLRNR